MVEGVKSVNVIVEDCTAHIESEAELDLDYLREEMDDMGFELIGKL